MDGGFAASNPSALRPPSSSLMEEIRQMLSYVDDRDSQVSLLKTIIKRKQEAAIPAEIPRDLILEAKVRIGDEKKFPMDRPFVDNRTSKILHVEREQGSLMADGAIDALKFKTSDVITSNTVDPNNGRNVIASDPNVVHAQGFLMAAVEIDALKNNRSDAITGSKVDQQVLQRVCAPGVFHELGSMAADVEIDALNNGSSIAKTGCRVDPVQNVSATSVQSVQAESGHLHLKNMAQRSDTWSSLFQKTTAGSRDLRRHTQPSKDPTHHIEFDEEDASAAAQNWGNSLVGYFIGNSPPLSDIRHCLSTAWRLKELEIIPMADGFLLFKFQSYDIGQSILDEGPWFVYGRPLILRRWSEAITMHRENLATIPVWIRLPNLNFCFRTNSALSKIGSVIGNPICMDYATATGTRYAFARICVEVDVDAELPNELRMKYKDQTIIQKIDYAWKPNPCKACRTFNHGEKSCPLKIDKSRTKQVWVPKKQSMEAVHNADNEESRNIPLDVIEKEQQQPVVEDWNVVKGKKIDKSTTKVSSPKQREIPSLSSNVESNRFLSLSNLDGDSNVPETEILATTALVIQGTTAIPSQMNSDGQQNNLFSIHQLDKSLLSRLPSSSSSARHKPRPAGITNKEKPHPKNRST